MLKPIREEISSKANENIIEYYSTVLKTEMDNNLKKISQGSYSAVNI